MRWAIGCNWDREDMRLIFKYQAIPWLKSQDFLSQPQTRLTQLTQLEICTATFEIHDDQLMLLYGVQPRYRKASS